MKLLKTYEEYLVKLFLKQLLIVILIFTSLTFILNILEEIKFFKGLELSFYYPILFALLNLPTLVFEIFPFIILITTQMFFMHLFNRDEITILKNYGIKNLDVIKIIAILSFLFGLFLIFGFHSFSSNLKHNYLSFKNNFTNDNKYLAVINENGLWIKDEVDNKINIINAENIEKNIIKKVSISQLNSEYEPIKTIFAAKIDISNEIWKISNAEIFNLDGSKSNKDYLDFNSNFNLHKINNLFSNLSSLNFLQLKSQLNDYKSLGYSTLDIESQIHKLFVLPIYLVLMITISSILMFNTKYNKSKIFNIIIGILMSVSIYYINYFFNIMGTNERIPVFLSIWFPMFVLSLFTIIGLLKINEK